MRLLVVKLLVIGSAVAAVAGMRLAAQGNAEAAKLQNPIEASPESAFYGKAVYLRHCANCHGSNAQGGTGSDQIPPSPDLTDAEWQHGSSDGEIFTSIKNGIPPDFKMPAWGEQLTQGDIWRITHYLRSLAKK